MLKRNIINILIIGTLSILIVPANSFAMKKRPPMQIKKRDPKIQINEILNEIDENQKNLINDMSDSFRFVYYSNDAISPDTRLYKDKEKLENLKLNKQNIKDQIQTVENRMHVAFSLTKEEEEELRLKIEYVKEIQDDISKGLECIQNEDSYNTYHAKKRISAKLNILFFKRLLKGSGDVTINIKECSHMGHDYVPLTNTSKCPVCKERPFTKEEKQHYKKNNKTPKLQQAKRLASNQEQLENPNNNHWLKPYLWPATKITLCASGAILALVLTSKLLGWR